MNIQMIGIDHSLASMDIRAKFAFTRKNVGEAMEILKTKAYVRGCVILSTCNRLEVWVSADRDHLPIYEYLCEIKGVEPEQYKNYFVHRENAKATEHLFYLTAGLKSQIMGEDQILTQVKDALNLAREHFVTDSNIEVLFRMAVTAGKKIKTEIAFAHGNTSVISYAIEKLKKEGFVIEGKKCLVIGNGEMGRVTAQSLLDEGGDVSVTVREYRSGIVDIPRRCRRINYSERMKLLPSCDIVVSATASPNYTLTYDLLKDSIQDPVIIIDLAVPRDVEQKVSEIRNVSLYDMDSFQNIVWDGQDEKILQAKEIIEDQISEYQKWLDGHDLIPRIQKLQSKAANDVMLRIQKPFKKAEIEESDREQLLKTVDAASGKVAAKMIYGLRDALSPDLFEKCIEGLEKIYEE